MLPLRKPLIYVNSCACCCKRWRCRACLHPSADECLAASSSRLVDSWRQSMSFGSLDDSQSRESVPVVSSGCLWLTFSSPSLAWWPLFEILRGLSKWRLRRRHLKKNCFSEIPFKSAVEKPPVTRNFESGLYLHDVMTPACPNPCATTSPYS